MDNWLYFFLICCDQEIKMKVETQIEIKTLKLGHSIAKLVCMVYMMIMSTYIIP